MLENATRLCEVRRDDDIDLESDELGHDLDDPLVTSLRPAIFNCDCPSLGPAEFVQSLHKSGGPFALPRSPAQEPGGRQFVLLRGRRERPRSRCAAKQRDEVAALHHSITSLARASTASGTVRPSALAVLRLITSSYLVGAWTGRSAAFSPLRIRST